MSKNIHLQLWAAIEKTAFLMLNRGADHAEWLM